MKRIACFIYAYSFKIEDTPEVFKLFVDFLKDEPNDNFSSSVFPGVKQLEPLYGDAPSKSGIRVPLTLNAKAESKFKSLFNKFSTIYESGKAGLKVFNLIYTLGQYLTILALYLSFFENEIGHDKIKKVYDIWDAREKMNAMGQAEKYSGKTTEQAKKDIIAKLEKSKEVIEKEILPFVHK